MCAAMCLCVLEGSRCYVTSHRVRVSCLYLLTGVWINTHRQSVVHTVTPSSVGDPALFKHILLFCFFNRCKKKKKLSIKPSDCMINLKYWRYDLFFFKYIHIYIQVQLCQLQCVARVWWLSKCEQTKDSLSVVKQFRLKFDASVKVAKMKL